MKIKTDLIRNPIIARLLIAQIFLVGLGFLAIFLAFIAIDRFNNERQMERLKKNLTVSIMPYEDQLLAWSKLGMISAQTDLLDKLKSQLHLQNLTIVSEDDLSTASPSAFTFILDSKLARDLGKSVLVEVNPEELRFNSISPSAGLLIAVGLLALLTIFYSAYFILQHVFKPIHRIRQSLERLESAEEITFDSTRTMGEIKDLIKVIQRLYLKSMTKENERIRNQVANSVAHDIRSPLAALKVVKDLGTHNMDANVAKLLTMSIDRITDIANTILPKSEKNKIVESNIENCFIWMLVDQIISEKRVEYKNLKDILIDVKYESSPFFLNAICNQADFMRSISNIINNSIEAKFEDRGLNIQVTVKRLDEIIQIIISDDGKGIPTENILKIFDEGFTSGKKQGSGLGLFQVKRCVESWNGTIDIQSTPKIGTVITINLKKSQRPKWLIDEIKIHDYQQIFVLDDEEYVFKIIKDKFGLYSKRFGYFNRIDDFEKTISTFSNSLFFIDYDLKQNLNGIELIQKYNLQKNSILLTGNYDDRSIQIKAMEMGLQILPKPLINDLPISA